MKAFMNNPRAWESLDNDKAKRDYEEEKIKPLDKERMDAINEKMAKTQAEARKTPTWKNMLFAVLIGAVVLAIAGGLAYMIIVSRHTLGINY